MSFRVRVPFYLRSWSVMGNDVTSKCISLVLNAVQTYCTCGSNVFAKDSEKKHDDSSGDTPEECAEARRPSLRRLSCGARAHMAQMHLQSSRLGVCFCLRLLWFARLLSSNAYARASRLPKPKDKRWRRSALSRTLVGKKSETRNRSLARMS